MIGEESKGPPSHHGHVVFGALVLTACMAVIVVFLVGDRTPRYSAAIDSASGLDDLGRSSLNPLFNLTLRVTSSGFMGGDCVEVGSAVEVSYAGVPLATGITEQLCARPRGVREQRVVARGTEVHVPGFALDRLAADGSRGAQAFDVEVLMPPTQTNDEGKQLVSCRGLVVGDAAALGAPCAVADVDMPPPNDWQGSLKSELTCTALGAPCALAVGCASCPAVCQMIHIVADLIQYKVY